MSKNTLVTLALLVIGLALGATPALAETVDWQQHVPGGDPSTGLVPIVAILMVFGAPALTVILVALFVFRHRERRQQLLNDRIQKFLENGQPVPENLMMEGDGSPAPQRHLNQGLVFLGAGIGLTVFLSLLSGFAVGSLGLVLVGIGVAKVLIWKLSANKAGE